MNPPLTDARTHGSSWAHLGRSAPRGSSARHVTFPPVASLRRDGPPHPGAEPDHTERGGPTGPLTRALCRVLDGASTGDELSSLPAEEHDALRALLTIHDLWMAPVDTLGSRVRFQHHPAVAGLKWRLEADLIERLDQRSAPEDGSDRFTAASAAAAMRRLAATDLVPAVYDWLVTRATWPELVEFLALEGGPDADFDDLVAMAQVGISGDPKVALAANYWDEMGRGDLDAVHTVLHDQLVRAIDMPRLDRADLSVSALERKALGGVLVTNRHLQPEALGALGLLEMQAGPRCRAVVRALTRLEAPAGAFPFYEEHAQADPRHGKEWLDRVVLPLAEDPWWAHGIVRGARWRADINRRFFADALIRFSGPEDASEVAVEWRRTA